MGRDSQIGYTISIGTIKKQMGIRSIVPELERIRGKIIEIIGRIEEKTNWVFKFL